jgi:peptidyl-prolyl cis-trans isomerase D
MLQALRNQASSWVIKILLGLLIVSFAIWGINDIFFGERDPAVAEIDGVKLTRSQVSEAVRDEVNRLQPLFGGRLDRDEAMRMGVTAQVLDSMIDRTVVMLAAREMGIAVSDEMVAQRITSDRTFFNARGQFDRSIFFQALSRAGMTEEYYVTALKRDLTAAQLNQAVEANTIAPSAMIDPLVRFRSEKRLAASVVVPAGPAEAVAEPTPAEIEAFYEANAARFRAPEYRDVTYLDLNPSLMADEIRVSEERLQQAYQERIDQFTTRDRREIEQVVFRTEAAARAAAQALKSGKSLAEAATEDGKPLSPVNLGWLEKSDMLPELAGPAFELAEGQFAGPLKTALGWHVIRVKGAQEGRVQPMEEVRDQLRREIATREASEAIYALTNRIEDALAAGNSLEQIAGQLNLKARRIPAIDSRGRDAQGEPLENLPKGGDFVRAAFETSEGQDSQLTETEGGGFFILHVNKVTPASVRPLDRIREGITVAWKEEARVKASERRAAAILDRLGKGEKIEDIARAEKLKVTTSEPFTRLTHDAESGLPAALMDKLFGLKPGEAAMAEGPGGFVVAVLAEIRPPSQREVSEAAAAIDDELRQAIAGDLFQQFVGALRTRFSIKTYPAVLRERS